MALQEPESMEDLVYFTRREIGEGFVQAWVNKGECPKCKKASMHKPRDEKTGKVKIRSKEYVCPNCNHVEEKEAFEETLTCSIKYVCPKCKHEGEAEVPYQRKTVQLINKETGKKKAAKAVIFFCEKCEEKIPITKKMKGN